MFKSTVLDRDVGLGDLIDLTGNDLRDLYNEITGKNVGRFGTRSIGIARVRKVLPAHKPTVKEKSEPRPGGSKGDPKRRVRFNAPKKSKIRKYRNGTKREKLIVALANGATFQQCQKATGWPYKVCFENIQLLHSYVGFGLKEDDEGVITLIF